MIDASPIVDIIDLDTYPLHRPGSAAYADLVDRCRTDLATIGMYDLPGFVRPEVIEPELGRLQTLIDTASFEHRRRHNIWFLPPTQLDAPPDHPALAQLETVNRTVCADQITGSFVTAVYEWGGVRRFVAATMGLTALHLMDDPLARVNVMAYRDGEGLNWHFDRSEYTTTLLLQRPTVGGEFEFRPGLRTDDDQNLDGVARLLAGTDSEVHRRHGEPGTLNVFFGKCTAHRVVPVGGDVDRVIAVFSFYERPGVSFTADEQLGFYGRCALPSRAAHIG